MVYRSIMNQGNKTESFEHIENLSINSHDEISEGKSVGT